MQCFLTGQAAHMFDGFGLNEPALAPAMKLLYRAASSSGVHSSSGSGFVCQPASPALPQLREVQYEPYVIGSRSGCTIDQSTLYRPSCDFQSGWRAEFFRSTTPSFPLGSTDRRSVDPRATGRFGRSAVSSSHQAASNLPPPVAYHSSTG